MRAPQVSITCKGERCRHGAVEMDVDGSVATCPECDRRLRTDECPRGVGLVCLGTDEERHDFAFAEHLGHDEHRCPICRARFRRMVS